MKLLNKIYLFIKNLYTILFVKLCYRDLPVFNIYCFWTGDNEMSESRAKALKILQNKSGCNVILVTPNNLSTFIKPYAPLHEGFDLLSLTHKSDYLRSYFMYHYGGGYSDIKPYPFNWCFYFIKLSKLNVDFVGASELSEDDIGSSNEEVKKSYRKLSSCCYFIFKPRSDFALEWCKRVNQKMDTVLERLKIQNGRFHPRAVLGGIHNKSVDDYVYYPTGYPLRWTELHGEILHQLEFDKCDKSMYKLILPIYRLSNAKFR